MKVALIHVVTETLLVRFMRINRREYPSASAQPVQGELSVT